MSDQAMTILKSRLDAKNLARLLAFKNPRLHEFVADAIELTNPASVFVCTDAPEDIAYVRAQAAALGEEAPLATPGHTVHFDGPNDQGRDKEVTRYLLKPGVNLGKHLNSMDRAEGLAEVRGFLKDTMAGRQMLVRFFTLGPTRSPFSISGVQATDSFYVGHSEDMLYREGYEQFKTLGDSREFITVLHSAGRLVNHVSRSEERRVG